ncbi:hypothetical protein T439DRAFT_116958 [Meredithblackwellia eburnea MCA 4105]
MPGHSVGPHKLASNIYRKRLTFFFFGFRITLHNYLVVKHFLCCNTHSSWGLHCKESI